MSITGYLSEFSLPELLQLLQRGQKTGLLAVQLLSEPDEPTEHYFLWFYQGNIVSATNRLDSRCFATLLCRQGYVTGLMISRLIRRCPPDVSLGTFLYEKGVLEKKQLKALFRDQVIQQVCGLFQLPDGCFQFDPRAPLPKVEMTGLSIPATEITLPGLRALENWDALQNKLPAPRSGLRNLVKGRPNVSINQAEWNVWKAIDGQTPLITMARQLQLPIENMQKIAFRLIVIGLAAEVPMMMTSMQSLQPTQTPANGRLQQTLFGLTQPLSRTVQSRTVQSRTVQSRTVQSRTVQNGRTAPQGEASQPGVANAISATQPDHQTHSPKVSQSFLSSLMTYLRRLPKSS
ncbi:MAG: DUF4388 domain-containing protein [Cyanobacteria bacterium P01_F01_bin.4]